MLRLVLAVIVGFFLGSAVNMLLILASGHVIPPPAGADVATTEGLRASIHLFEARHFVFPFLAHALGTFAGVFVASWLAPDRSAMPAYIVGALFLLGGCAAAFMVPAPTWFKAIDLLLAYVPPAWLAHRIASRVRRARTGVA